MLERTCYACGASADEGARCHCGEPLWLATDPTPDGWPDRIDSMWAFGAFLPTEPPAGVGGIAGGTPLFRAAALDEFAGCRLSIKDETANPTGSFKDRGSAVGVALAAERETELVATVSHGNMALSVAAVATGAGLNAVALVPADVPTARIGNLARFDPEIVPVDGDYGRLYYDALDAGRALGVPVLNSDVPSRVAGQKTTVLEILAALAPDVPDGIALPVSSGGHASAAWKALRECVDAGLIDEIPPLYLVQAAACAPIATAYDDGSDAVSRIEPGETIAYSIANADPPSGTRALTAARETGGAVVAVSDDRIADAQRRITTGTGLAIEPSSATAVAGVRALADDGVIDADDEIVSIATGTAFTEGLDAETTVPPSIPRDLIDERLRSISISRP